MSATDLIVPVKVNALVVNRLTRTAETFNRCTPNFDAMIEEGAGAALAGWSADTVLRLRCFR